MSKSVASQLRELVQQYGLSYFKRYYSFYPAWVEDNADPQQLHRLRLSCPAVWGNNVPQKWIAPLQLYAGKQFGSVHVPAVGQKVYVCFMEGDSSAAFYMHANYAENQLPEALKEDYPDSLGFVDESGLLLRFNRKKETFTIEYPGLFRFTLDEGKIFLSYLDSVTLQLSKDEVLLETENGKISQNASGYKLEDSKGNEVGATLKDLTTHITKLTVPTPMGPSGPPVNIADFQTVLQTLSTLFQ